MRETRERGRQRDVQRLRARRIEFTLLRHGDGRAVHDRIGKRIEHGGTGRGLVAEIDGDFFRHAFEFAGEAADHTDDAVAAPRRRARERRTHETRSTGEKNRHRGTAHQGRGSGGEPRFFCDDARLTRRGACGRL
jgi:hypothetical protein